MTFPLFDGERPYVLIIRGDGFPCGSRSWVQWAIGFANHGPKARTPAYNWTIDVALTSEHDIDAVCDTFSKTLEAIQSIIKTYTSIGLVHGAGRAPMTLHTHGGNDCALTGEITIGDFDGDTFSLPVIWEGGKSRPVHGHIGGSESYGDTWSMQEQASPSMHIICMDLRVRVGNTMPLYATQVHRGHA